jgi:hypothetical protein
LLRYATLVRARKECHACAGLINPATCDGGIYDSDHIGPLEPATANLDADLVIVGQDWGDMRYFAHGHALSFAPRCAITRSEKATA